MAIDFNNLYLIDGAAQAGYDAVAHNVKAPSWIFKQQIWIDAYDIGRRLATEHLKKK